MHPVVAGFPLDQISLCLLIFGIFASSRTRSFPLPVLSRLATLIRLGELRRHGGANDGDGRRVEEFGGQRVDPVYGEQGRRPVRTSWAPG